MKLRNSALIIMCSLGLSAPAFADGIPTVDPMAIQQMIKSAEEQARQALDQLNTMKDQVSQTKANFEHVKSTTEGNSGLGDVMNDPTLTSYLPKQNWNAVYDK